MSQRICKHQRTATGYNFNICEDCGHVEPSAAAWRDHGVPLKQRYLTQQSAWFPSMLAFESWVKQGRRVAKEQPLPLPGSFAGHELEAMAIMLRVLDAILTVASDKAKEVEGSTPKPCN